MNNVDIHFTQQLEITKTDLSTVKYEELQTQTLTVYVFDSEDLPESEISQLAEIYLHHNEKVLLTKRRHLQAKREYIATRYLLKQHVSKCLQIPFEHLSVLFSDKEKLLQVYNNNQLIPLSCCISHSRGLVAVAITNTMNELGIDIEKIMTTRSLTPIAKRYFHKQELQVCAPKDNAALYRLWTLKEALAKATRQPIAKMLSENVFAYNQRYNFRSGMIGEFDLSVITKQPLSDKLEVKLIPII